MRSDGYRVISSSTSDAAIQMALKIQPDLFLIDVMMPDIDGFDLAIMFKSAPELIDIPIIFLSAIKDAEAKMKGFDLGAVDYITKPYQSEEILSRVSFHIRLSQLEKERIVHIDQLQARERELEALNKEKDNILRVVSHDMRNPLNGIIGVSEILREDVDNEEVRYMLELIEQSGEGLLSLVNDLIELAGVESGSVELKIKENNLIDLIRTSVKLNSPPAVAKKVTIEEPEEEHGPVIVKCDKSKIVQLINNLISNAIKFTKSGGTISVKATRDNKEAVLTISDTGIGIPEDVKETMFTKGGKHNIGTDGEKGTGLGMAIVKRIVKLHGGKIEVESELGEGTTFIIRIPV